MRTRRRRILLFLAGCAAVFLFLVLINIPRPLGEPTLQAAAQKARKLDDILTVFPVDWEQVQDLFAGPLEKVVADTDRFVEDVRLNYKIRDAIAAGKEEQAPEVQAIIIRRTLLRAFLYQLNALLRPRTEPETKMDLAARTARIEVLAGFLDRFARTEAEGYGIRFNSLLAQWKASGQEKDAALVVDFWEGMIARIVLDRMARWQLLDKGTKEGRYQAVVYQAEMRQFYHILYPKHAETEKQLAWQVLTEFTNDPQEMNAALIVEAIPRVFATQMQWAGGR